MKAIFYNGELAEAHIGDIIAEIYGMRLYKPVLIAAARYDGQNPQLWPATKDSRKLTIVDVGANIGLTVTYFATQANVERVIAVEPCAAHVECLEATKKANGLKNVDIYKCALSGVEGVSELHHAINPTSHSIAYKHGKSASSEKVITTTTKGMLSGAGIDTVDILKLDAEGSESEIVLSESFKEVAHKIRYIIGEWHSWTYLSQEAFARELNTLGYVIGWLQTGDSNAPKIFIAWREGEAAPDYSEAQ